MAKHVDRRKFKVGSEQFKNKSYFSFSVLSTRQVMALVFISIAFIATVLLTVFSGFEFHKQYDYKDDFIEYGKGWTASYLNENDEVTRVVTDQDTKFFKFNNEVDETKIVLTKFISTSDMNDAYKMHPYLGFFLNYKDNAIKVYSDTNDDGDYDDAEDFVYEIVSFPTNRKVKSNSSLKWFYVKLPDNFADHKINLVISCENNILNSLYIQSTTLGSSGAIYSDLVLKSAVPFAIGIVLIVLSLIAGVFTIFNGKGGSVGVFISFYLGLCAGILLLAQYGYIWIATNLNITECYIKVFALSAIIFGFSFAMYGKAANIVFVNVGRIFLWLSIIACYGALIISLVNSLDLSAFIPYLYILLVVTIIFVFINYALISTKEKSQRPLTICIGIILVSVIAEIVLYLLNLKYLQVLIFSLAVFIFFIVSILIEHRQAYCLSTTEVKKNQIENDQKVAIMLAQIQPHFLYNSLNSIAILCDINPRQAHDLTLKFSQYLRSNIDSLSQQTPIHFTAELKNIKNYLDIEKVRFSTKLNVVENIQVSDFFVPVLTIQPIVENAVKHGVSKRATPGVVMITTSEDYNNYYIIIDDNGVGFNTDMIDKSEKMGKSIGIINVKYRLKSIMNADMQIESAIGKGTKVTVTLPKVSNKIHNS